MKQFKSLLVYLLKSLDCDTFHDMLPLLHYIKYTLYIKLTQMASFSVLATMELMSDVIVLNKNV